jgi:hypothetical protein
MPPESYDDPVWQDAGPTVWGIFGSESDMFGRAEQQWTINFRVRDLDAMVRQLRAADVAVEVDPEKCPTGGAVGVEAVVTLVLEPASEATEDGPQQQPAEHSAARHRTSPPG